MELARQNYCKGGMTFYECWEEYQFNDWVKLFGEITTKEAMKMFEAEARSALIWAQSF